MKKRLLVLVLLVSLPLVSACNENNGGVEVDGKCFDCGVADQVCPADFGAECKIIDPDCNAIASIFVRVVEWLKGLLK